MVSKWRGGLGTGLLVSVAAACGSPVVHLATVPTPSAGEELACQRLVASLPPSIGNDLPRRRTTPESADVVAWGNPAVVLYCGVGIPADYRPDSHLQIVNGIGWYEDTRGTDRVYTTTTRTPRVAVAVPRRVQSSFEILVDLSAAVAAYSAGPNLVPR